MILVDVLRTKHQVVQEVVLVLLVRLHMYLRDCENVM